MPRCRTGGKIDYSHRGGEGGGNPDKGLRLEIVSCYLDNWASTNLLIKGQDNHRH